MNKIRTKLNSVALAKATTLGMMVLFSVNAVMCTDIFTASKSVLNKVSAGLYSILSLVAVIMIIWNVLMLFVHSSDEKKLAVHKEAVKKIFLYYIIAILAVFLLSQVASTITNALGGSGTIIDTGTFNNDGTLQ